MKLVTSPDQTLRPQPSGQTEILAARQEALTASLLKAASATAALTAWAAHRGWPEPVQARKLETGRRRAPAEICALLQADGAELLGFRRVELVCGERVLSRADNWYAIQRLPPAIARALDGGSTPFGQLVSGLAPQRMLLGVKRLWEPAAGPAPEALLNIRAVVSGLGADGREPLAAVSETYMLSAID